VEVRRAPLQTGVSEHNSTRLVTPGFAEAQADGLESGSGGASGRAIAARDVLEFVVAEFPVAVGFDGFAGEVQMRVGFHGGDPFDHSLGQSYRHQQIRAPEKHHHSLAIDFSARFLSTGRHAGQAPATNGLENYRG